MNKYDRRMKKVYNFYDNPIIEETYALDYNLVRMIIPKLELFIEKSKKIIDWDEHTRYSNTDVVKTCNEIIKDFKYYLDKYDSINTVEDYEKLKTRVKHGFELLSDIITHLSW